MSRSGETRIRLYSNTNRYVAKYYPRWRRQSDLSSPSSDSESEDSFETSPREEAALNEAALAAADRLILSTDKIVPINIKYVSYLTQKTKPITWRARLELTSHELNKHCYMVVIYESRYYELLHFTFEHVNSSAGHIMLWSVVGGDRSSEQNKYRFHFTLTGLHRTYEGIDYADGQYGDRIQFFGEVRPNIDQPYRTQMMLGWYLP